MAMSDSVLAVVQLDQRYYKGLGVALGLAGQLDIPHKSLVVNLASPSFEPQTVQQTIEQSYGWPVAGVVPYCDELSLSALCDFRRALSQPPSIHDLPTNRGYLLVFHSKVKPTRKAKLSSTYGSKSLPITYGYPGK